jgi:ubiquitin carboxyl-terminal hydrolase 1
LETIDKGTETTPVASSLADLLRHLNTPLKYATALHPDEVARALMQSDKNRLLATREQQDAQEFFSLLLDTLESESTRQWLVENRPPGLETITNLNTTSPSKLSVDPQISIKKAMSTLEPPIPNPFEGLSANRMGCLKCKYVENIRHEKFGPMVLPLTVSGSTTLTESIQKAFEIEILDDVECQKCTLLAYRTNLLRLLDKLPPGNTATTEATRRVERIDMALRSGKLDDANLLGGDVRKFIQRSPKTKHNMIARPPRLLAFHIQRSNFHNFTGRALKNQASVGFPRMLDVSEYVTTSELSMDPEEPISQWKEGDARTIYKLKSVIMHYGLHNIGHYVAYRSVGDKWFRISDEDVEYVACLNIMLTLGLLQLKMF